VATGHDDSRAKRFTEPFQTDSTCPVPSPKIFPFGPDPNHRHILRHPGPHRGAYRDRHGRWARGVVDAHGIKRANGIAGRLAVSDDARGRRTMPSRTVKTCGPDASTPASSQRRQGRPNRVRQGLNPLATVTRKPDRRGEHAISRNPSRVGAPGESGEPVVSVRLHLLLCTRSCGCSGHPAFPHTLFSRQWDFHNSGACAARSRRCGFTKYALFEK
jgi:hypothetical protein